MVTAASQASDLRLLNGDEKTVARLSIEALTVSRPAVRTHDAPGTTHSANGTQTAQGANGVLPTRLTIHEVRGYPSAARRARRLLAGTDGVSVTRRPRWTPRWRPTAVMPWTTPARSTSDCAPACPAGRRSG